MTAQNTDNSLAGPTWAWSFVALTIFCELIWGLLLAAILPSLSGAPSGLLGAVVLSLLALPILVLLLVSMIVALVFLKTLGSRIFNSLLTASLLLEIGLTIYVIAIVG